MSLRRRLDAVARSRGDSEVWFTDLGVTGDGLCYLAGTEHGITREAFDALPEDRDRTLVEIVDEPERPNLAPTPRPGPGPW